MTLKVALATFALTIAPTLALAMGCQGGHSEASMSCAEGTTWDAATQTCVDKSTS